MTPNSCEIIIENQIIYIPQPRLFTTFDQPGRILQLRIVKSLSSHPRAFIEVVPPLITPSLTFEVGLSTPSSSLTLTDVMIECFILESGPVFSYFQLE